MVWLKKVQTNSKLRAFTIVEMVITLVVSLGLVTLGAIEITRYKEKMILTNTTQELKSSIEQAARISTIRHRAALIRYYPTLKKVTITGTGYSQVLNIDPHIDIYNLSNLKISATGSMPPHSITVTNHKDTRKIKLQMTWGRAIDGV